MDSSETAKQLLLRVGAKLGRTEGQMSKFLTAQALAHSSIRLDDEWIQTAEQLSAMSESQLSSLGFPMALRMALLDLSKGSAEPAAPAPAPVPKTVAPPAPSQEEIELAMVEASVKKKIKDFAETSGADQASRSLKTISKILGNILKDPDDVKKQELKYENAVMKRDITPFKDAGDLLVMAGFKLTDLTFKITKLKPKVLDRVFVLCLAASEQLAAQAPKYEFDPYKSHLISANPGHKVKGDEKFEPGYMQAQIEEQRAAQENELKQLKIERNPMIIDPRGVQSRSAVEKRLQKIQLEEEEKLSELKQLKLEIMRIGKKDENFKSKREKELAQIKKAPVFESATVRINLPDGLILQGTFNPFDRATKVAAFLREHCAQPEREFILFSAPPYRPLDLKTNPTLKEARLVPSGVLRMRWSDLEKTTEKDGPFLEPASVAAGRFVVLEE